VALPEQEADGVGADVAGSAGNENFSWSHGGLNSIVVA
jgi:hypothetical protein